MKAEVVLTVSESKRLIAKGVAAMPAVQAKMAEGIIVVTTGSTDAYVYEELTGTIIEKRAYLTGRTYPESNKPKWPTDGPGDLVLVNGVPDPSLDRFSALEKMKQGDIYIKGANALNYGARLAGVSIGHPRGGTLGGSLGVIYGAKLHFIIPVGLEKEIPFDIAEASELLSEEDERLTPIHSLWPVHGDIVTELEALETLTGVMATPVAAGGVAGAEGALRLLLLGTAEQVRDAVELVKSIQGEPPLL